MACKYTQGGIHLYRGRINKMKSHRAPKDHPSSKRLFSLLWKARSKEGESSIVVADLSKRSAEIPADSRRGEKQAVKRRESADKSTERDIARATYFSLSLSLTSTVASSLNTRHFSSDATFFSLFFKNSLLSYPSLPRRSRDVSIWKDLAREGIISLNRREKLWTRDEVARGGATLCRRFEFNFI